MEPLQTFCLAGLVFLSMPLPIFASAALRANPAAKIVIPWVWANALVLGVLGLLLISTSTAPVAWLIVGGAFFIAFGTRMVGLLAQAASVRTTGYVPTTFSRDAR